ncbi:MAG: MarR family transcriptional regulator [Polyangiaceae bacterium]
MDLQKAAWFAAMRWRRAVEAVTARCGLTFTQWLVLDAIRELHQETGDASIQNEIAVRVELDRSTVSQVMRALESKGLVDRGIDFIGTAWRTLLTERAVTLLADLRPRISATCARTE